MLFTKKLDMSQEEAHQKMQSGEKYILLDVRSPDEFAEGYIEGAKLLPVNELPQRAASELPDKDALIMIYCHSGGRAGVAAKQLERMGYTNVFNIGGIMNWPYEVVR
jgi:rhodanese-related sulfurtransferase